MSPPTPHPLLGTRGSHRHRSITIRRTHAEFRPLSIELRTNLFVSPDMPYLSAIFALPNSSRLAAGRERPSGRGCSNGLHADRGHGEPGVAADSGDMASPAKLPTRLPLSRSRASRRSLLRSRRLSSWTSLQGGVSLDTFVPSEGGMDGGYSTSCGIVDLRLRYQSEPSFRLCSKH